jgi:hypothetical protein
MSFTSPLSDQTLYDCYIEASGFCGLSASNLADFLAAKAEEECQSLAPLIH